MSTVPGGSRTRRAAQRLFRLGEQLIVNPTSSSTHNTPEPSFADQLPDVSGAKETIAMERQQASFDSRQMTYLLDEGPENTKRKEKIFAAIEHDLVLLDPGYYDRTRVEARERVARKLKRFAEVKPKGDPEEEWMWHTTLGLYDPSFFTRYGVHSALFGGAIAGQGTEDLIKKYMPQVDDLSIVGVFGMTELGHGSAIREFETTATFNRETDQFIINTPTLTATKWWIGGLAHIATHIIVFARLIIDNKDYGVHSFVMQIRDREGRPLPGLTIGDCGKKMGRDGIDNGWIQFHNVPIPRTNMLMKWAKVSREGVYTKPPKAQLAYGALLKGRVGLIADSADHMAKALTVAIRYSVVRRQFADHKGQPERQLLDFPTHQVRLLEALAGAYAWHFTASVMWKDNRELAQKMAKGDLANLADLHATSAGLKAFATWHVAESIEQARQCMGGHGYSSYSGLPTLISDFAVNQTWEGDNTVMALQTAQYLIKSLTSVMEGKRLVGSASYLERIPAILQQSALRANSVEDFSEPRVLLEALERAAVKAITKAGRRIQKEMQSGKNKHEAWNACLLDLVAAADHHCFLYVFHAFLQSTEKTNDKQVLAVLKKLFELFVLARIKKIQAILLVDQFMNEKQVELLYARVRALLWELRKDAVALVDAFNLPDFIVNSPLGRFDGDVYRHYFATVNAAPDARGKAPYWDELIKPVLRDDL
jgi:acyl-CoA oxidase